MSIRNHIDLVESAIVEAPLADFETFGDLDKEGSFRADDLKAVRSEKWLTKVNAQFKNFPYPLNVYIYNGEDGFVMLRGNGLQARDVGMALDHSGPMDPSEAQKLLGKLPPNIATSISAILIENEGGDRVPLTPWILGHRIAHALLQAGESRNGEGPLRLRAESLFRAYNNALYTIGDILRRDPAYQQAENADQDGVGRITRVAMKIGTMRSARTGRLANDGEFAVEMMVQVMIKGRVEFARPTLSGLGQRREPYTGPTAELFDVAIRNGRITDGEEFARKVVKPVKPPRSTIGYQVHDAQGVAILATGDETRARHYASEKPGSTVKMIKPNKSAITRYENYRKKFAQVAAQWEEWSESGLLAANRHPSMQDALDAQIGFAEQALTDAIQGYFKACVGKIVVL